MGLTGYGFSGDGFSDGGCGGKEGKGRLVRMGSYHGGRRGREEGKREKPGMRVRKGLQLG